MAVNTKLSQVGAQVAEQFDTAKNATPTPGQFDEARREFTAAQARRDPTGMAMAARQYAQMQARAVYAAMQYHGAATSAVNTLGTPLQTAPATARDGSGVQAVGFHTPAPQGRGRPGDPPDPSPGGWSKDPLMRAAQKIAYGHASDPTTGHMADFPGMTKDQLADLVYQKLKGATQDAWPAAGIEFQRWRTRYLRPLRQCDCHPRPWFKG